MTPELNPPAQRSLPRIFYWIFYCFFKRNEMKFCTLRKNWLIREKIFTFSYNKFRLVSRSHYMKYGVNSSLLT